ncbi:helix-turn-helix domain-containing protein [Ilumatobacter sp.]|uniref:helix-turn-helix domain-containing protein n=2 Tax=Ilumatobacter sp. TaxID=1967498 RepID=UPI0037514106
MSESRPAPSRNACAARASQHVAGLRCRGEVDNTGRRHCLGANVFDRRGDRVRVGTSDPHRNLFDQLRPGPFRMPHLDCFEDFVDRRPHHRHLPQRVRQSCRQHLIDIHDLVGACPPPIAQCRCRQPGIRCLRWTGGETAVSPARRPRRREPTADNDVQQYPIAEVKAALREKRDNVLAKYLSRSSPGAFLDAEASDKKSRGETAHAFASRCPHRPRTTLHPIVQGVVRPIVSGPPRYADVPQCRMSRLYLCMTLTPTVRTSPPNRKVPRALLVSVREAADMLAISRSSVYNLIDADQLTPIRIGRSVRFPVEQLERFVAARIAGEAAASSARG